MYTLKVYVMAFLAIEIEKQRFTIIIQLLPVMVSSLLWILDVSVIWFSNIVCTVDGGALIVSQIAVIVNINILFVSYLQFTFYVI